MSRKKQKMPVNEWSHFINADHVDKAPKRVKIEANEQQCKDIAQRATIVDVISINADLTLEREQAGRVVHVAGRLEAILILECASSAENFEYKVEEPVEGWFEDKQSTVSFMKALKEKEAGQKNHSQKGGVEVEIVPEEEDPEDMPNGQIDLGELCVQHLILAIPPYPRKEGAEHPIGDDSYEPDKDSPLRKNPFEALKDWKEER